jgi:peptidoglycan/LPS O-acetylase OafA/YrhL
MEPEVRHKPVRYYEIDLLRFIAALSVVLFHFTYRGYHADHLSPVDYPALGAVFKYGYLGVELFFIISGYVVLLSAQGKTLGQFIISRITRLYPAYWVACTFTFLVQYLGKPAVPSPAWPAMLEASARTYVFNMTMFQNFLRVPDLDGVYWTLKVELVFYLVVALLIVTKSFRYLVPLLAAWVGYCLYFGPVAFGRPLSFLLFPRFAPFFIAGMVFYLIQTSQAARWKLYSLLLLSYVAALWSTKVVLTEMITVYQQPFSLIVAWGAVTVFFSVFLLVINRQLQVGQAKWLAWAGALTYPIYLLHHNVGYVAFQRLGGLVPKYVLLPALLAAVFGLAYLLHVQVERRYSKPLSQLLQKLFARVGLK